MAGTRGRAKPWLYSIAAAPALLWSCVALGGWAPACDHGMRVPGLTWREGNYPIAAANWIAEHAPDAKLWNDLTSGGWYAWRLGEGRTSIDGNTDGYPLAYLESYAGGWPNARPPSPPSDAGSLLVTRVDHPSGRLRAIHTGLRGGMAGVVYCDAICAVFRELSGAVPSRAGAGSQLAADIRSWAANGVPGYGKGQPWPLGLEKDIAYLLKMHAGMRRTVLLRAEAGVVIYPERPSMWQLLARASDLNNHTSRAAVAWKKAIELLPRGTERLKAKAELSKLKARMREAHSSDD